MGEVAGILLAAGSSERFGADKLRHPLPGGTAIGVAAARNLIRVVPRTVAVVAPGSERLQALLSEAGCELIVNGRSESGMGTSVAAGVRATRDADGWLIALADMPWIRPETIGQLRERLRAGASIVAPVYEGKRGHPVGFSAAWGERLVRLQGRFGARNLIAAAGDLIELLDTQDAGVVRDVDHPGDVLVGGRNQRRG